MKFLICFMIIVFVGNVSKAQRPPAGSYVTSTDIDKFVGVWKWSNVNDEVIIEFKKVKLYWFNYYQDILLGCHTYKKNGVIIESSMNDTILIQPNMNNKKGTLLVYNVSYEGPMKVFGTLKDMTLNKIAKVIITYMGGTIPQIQLESTPAQDVVIAPAPLGLTLPRNIILTKQ